MAPKLKPGLAGLGRQHGDFLWMVPQDVIAAKRESFYPSS